VGLLGVVYAMDRIEDIAEFGGRHAPLDRGNQQFWGEGPWKARRRSLSASPSANPVGDQE
jgi:hypothetical protein